MCVRLLVMHMHYHIIFGERCLFDWNSGLSVFSNALCNSRETNQSFEHVGETVFGDYSWQCQSYSW